MEYEYSIHWRSTYARELSALDSLYDWLEDVQIREPELIDALPTGDHSIFVLTNAYKRFGGEVRDGWENEYRIVITDTEVGRTLNYYSTGHDGVSKSNGNDPDDINSWGQNASEYYYILKRRHRLQRAAGNAVFLFCIPVMPILAGLYELWRSSQKYAAGKCQACGYDMTGTPTVCPECGHTT